MPSPCHPPLRLVLQQAVRKRRLPGPGKLPWKKPGFLTRFPRCAGCRDIYRGYGLDFRFEGWKPGADLDFAYLLEVPLWLRPGMFLTDGRLTLKADFGTPGHLPLRMQDFAPHSARKSSRHALNGAIKYQAYAEKLTGRENALEFHCPESLRLDRTRATRRPRVPLRPASLDAFSRRMESSSK